MWAPSRVQIQCRLRWLIVVVGAYNWESAIMKKSKAAGRSKKYQVRTIIRTSVQLSLCTYVLRALIKVYRSLERTL